jgi:hypothetical protein
VIFPPFRISSSSFFWFFLFFYLLSSILIYSQENYNYSIFSKLYLYLRIIFKE